MAWAAQPLEVASGPWVTAVLDGDHVVYVGGDRATGAERLLVQYSLACLLPAFAVVEVFACVGGAFVGAGVDGAAASVGGWVWAPGLGAEAGWH
jgi:hypothetical protein